MTGQTASGRPGGVSGLPETPNKLECLRRMRALAEEVWQMTSVLILTGETDRADSEISDYSGLMNRRAPLVQAMEQFKRQADAADGGSQASACADEKRAVDHILNNITLLDKEHRTIATRIRASLQTSITGVRTGQKLSAAYAGMTAAPRSRRLDTTQ